MSKRNEMFKGGVLDKELLCLIPAGGQGSRLRPLTNERTKPALALSFDNGGEITRMVDIPLTAVHRLGGSAVVSTLYRPESLEFINNYDYAQTIREEHPQMPPDTFVQNIDLLEASSAHTIGLIPGDAWVNEDIIGEMWEAMESHNADAAMLSTRHLGIHNRRPVDSRGIMTDKRSGEIEIADLGVHLFKKEWLLRRLAICAEIAQQRELDIFQDVYNVDDPAGEVLMHVPRDDRGWVDMGTAAAFHNSMSLMNQQHADKNGNIVFPGANLKPNSSHTIALPNSNNALPLRRAIIPEGITTESVNDVLLTE